MFRTEIKGVKEILERLTEINRLIDAGCYPREDLSALQLEIEIYCRKAGVELVSC